MNLVTSAGPLGHSRPATSARVAQWYTRVLSWLSRTLFVIIPSTVGGVLTDCLRRMWTPSSWLLAQYPVYDLVDVEHDHAFSVLSSEGVLVAHNCQSTGVDCLLKFVHHIDQLRRVRGVPMRPFHVNQHDATTWAVKRGHEAEARAVFEDALVALNVDLAPSVVVPGAPKFIPMTGGVEVGQSLWDFKKE